MNQKTVREILEKDPDEIRKKSPAEILEEWHQRKFRALVYVIPFAMALLYLSFWAFSEARLGTFKLSDRIPVLVRWAIGLAMFSVLGWLLYGLTSYRCPKCQRFVRMDWTFGIGALRRKHNQDASETCRYCRAELE